MALRYRLLLLLRRLALGVGWQATLLALAAERTGGIRHNIYHYADYYAVIDVTDDTPYYGRQYAIAADVTPPLLRHYAVYY